MIRIIKEKERLLVGYVNFEYEPWVETTLVGENKIRIGKAFWFTNEDIAEFDLDDDKIERLFEGETPEAIFILGKKEGDYYQIKSRTLKIKHDACLSIEMPIEQNTFLAYRDISIFRKIDNITSEPIIIGGKHENAIPLEEFKALLKSFPNSWELTKYTDSKISAILKDYFETMTDAQEKFESYLKKKEKRGMRPLSENKDEENVNELYKHEIEKYEYIKTRIGEELKAGDSYSEARWQNLMMNFVLLLFPKYIVALKELKLRDFYFNKSKLKNRRIDIALVDTNGNLDIIEIKKPSENSVITNRQDRENHIPRSDLTSAIMQAEKYIFHLNKWGIEGEKKITHDHKDKLPIGMEIQITNPKAIIIIGRSKGLSKEQLFDFEVIRRKYSNIIDIITYDDLLERLDNIIKKFKN